MDLQKAQAEFSIQVAFLILHAAGLGLNVALGDAYRDSRCMYGLYTSKHRKRLAIDLNLYKDGLPLMKRSDYAPLGKFWEAVGGIWGGNFGGGTNPEAQEINHFEWPYEGEF